MKGPVKGPSTRWPRWFASGCAALLLGSTLPLPSATAEEVDLKAVTSLKKDKKKYGPYVGVFGGTTSGQSGDLELNGFEQDLLDADGDAVFGFEVGYSWRTKYFLEFGLEFEGLFSSGEISATYDALGNAEVSPTLGDIATVTTDMNYAAFMFNGVMTLDLKRLRPRVGRFLPRFRPYIGGGVGGAQVWFRNQRTTTFGDLTGTPTAPTTTPFSQDSFVLAYQIFGGVQFMITDKVGVYAEYRRLTLEKIDDISNYENEMWLGGLQIRY